MKRNNIFMWAYISFIIFSALLRIFVEFSLWSPIVLAITVSSVFFALEDLYTSLCHSLKDSIDIVDNFLSEERKKYDREMRYVAKLGRAISLYEDSIQDIMSKDSYESFRDSYREADDIICSIEKGNEEKRNKIKIYQKATNTCAYLGFLCLFFTLIIANSLTVPEIVQEILTVVPFALILITRQINGIFAERNGDLLNKCKSTLGAHTQDDVLDKIEERFDDYVSRIAGDEQKEAHHAH